LDYIAQQITVTAPVTLSGGVAVGAAGTYGFYLSGAGFSSSGLANKLNRLVKYSLVQESTNVWDTLTNNFGLLYMSTSSGTRPDISLSFTEVALPADASNRRALLDVGTGYTTFSPNQLRLRDSQLLSTGVAMRPDTSGMSLSFTNCLFERPAVAFSDGSFGSLAMTVALQNNTFIKGSLGLTHSTNSSSWYAYDNFFETASVSSGTVTILNARNGYYSTTVLSGSGGGDVVLNTLDYQTGPLGRYYWNTSASATNTAYLINKDTTSTPASVGLYHYTTRPDQFKDGTNNISALDIGFHYLATTGSSSTTPVDTDGDGIPDYLEDANGNGVTDSGETDWNNPNDIGLWVRITEPKDSSNIP
jgi:hypothetical protein